MVTQRYEAEDAVLSGAVISNQNSGASGGEYADYINASNDYVEWNINAATAGSYDLSFGYALGNATARTLSLRVDGTVVATLDFNSTGSWTNWSQEVYSLDLSQGNHTVRLTATGESGPNVDYLQISNEPAFEPFTANINFQPNASAVPSGYTRDIGFSYNESRGYGWVTESTAGTTNATPLSVTAGTRDRNTPGYDQRADTFIYMEKSNYGAAAWEYKLANGTYAVTVSVGDSVIENGVVNRINIEGETVINSFVSTAGQNYAIETAIVEVSDGKLTIDSKGGTNTKINYVNIERVDPDAQPEIASASPQDNATNVTLDASVSFDVSLAQVSVGVDGQSLSEATVTLYETNGLIPVEGVYNTTGGGDAIVFNPTGDLKPNTHYTMVINGATDTAGTEFVPYTTSFTTGTDEGDPDTGVTTERSVVAENDLAVTLLVSPDNTKLYASTVDGKIIRWDIDQATGTLSNKQVYTGLQGDPSAPSAIIGLAFDPNDPDTLWVSHNDSYNTDPEEFSGKISKLHIDPDDSSFEAEIEPYIVGLPRSNHDHLTNSLNFGSDGNLYVTQGSNTAMGDLDNAWGDRAETELSAAMLQIDPDRDVSGGPINVQTDNYVNSQGVTIQGNYNPNAANAPVTVYASGLRNAYDHLWHSNGNVYAADNGSAAGGVVPDNPATAADEGFGSVTGQGDVLYLVEEGGYYGHPNPSRGEYIMRGGNPTSGVDPDEVVDKGSFNGYDVGTQPDPDYENSIYNFGDKQSANGIIEYTSDAYGDDFQGTILVARYSSGDDIVALTLDANGQVVESSIFADNLIDPLDLIEHQPSGRIYVAEFKGSQSQITMLSPVGNPGGSDRYEAEDAFLFGDVAKKSFHTGYTGSGYVDYGGSRTRGDYIEWTVDADGAGSYDLEFIYAMSSSNARPLDVYVNDTLVVNNLSFTNTGSWSNWDSVNATVNLLNGENSIRLQTDGFSGPNIDALVVG